jgi:hypothetical protein
MDFLWRLEQVGRQLHGIGVRMQQVAIPEDLIREMEVVIAKRKIEEVLYTYCKGVDRCDLELLKSCYWPDSYDDHGRLFAGNGQEFCEVVVPALRQVESTTHSITNFLIEVDGDRAFSECQWSIIHRFREPECILDWQHQGRYLNILERRHGEWKISIHRIVKDSDRLHITRDLADASEAAGLPAARGAASTQWGARYPDDLSYKKFALGDGVPMRPAADATTYWDALRKLKTEMHPKPK